MQCILCIAFYALPSMYCIVCIVFFVFYSLHSIQCIAHNSIQAFILNLKLVATNRPSDIVTYRAAFTAKKIKKGNNGERKKRVRGMKEMRKKHKKGR
jgi:hypothetical protein